MVLRIASEILWIVGLVGIGKAEHHGVIGVVEGSVGWDLAREAKIGLELWFLMHGSLL